MTPLKIFCTSLLMLFFSESGAQSSTLGKYTITVQPLQLFCRDLPITVERTFKRNTLGFTLGYRFDSRLDRNPNGLVRYWLGEFGFTSPWSKAVTLGVNSKYFLSRNNNLYIDGQLFYRYWWFDNRFHRTNHSSGDNYNYITSSRRNVIGFKLLLGYKSNLKDFGNIRTILYSYFGLGYRYQDEHEVGVRGITNYSISTPRYFPYQNTSNVYSISLHLGCSIGIEIFKKNKIEE